ncbi:MAG: hypothetical protein ACP5J5_02980 [Dissulfurimicrobium sp.]|uniref:hypothetical protein n=1 Tax=Dissulfurimicrobium hydrothermale TaxID=1750598 RepID=UPI001EDC1D32|nr:hypothetical protein [Dissulfurimicrobium hydrothermale]UKL14666.1 hypothetical protein LGS26_03170 [Dissulfurimicrobium hydrothermale]
MSNSPLSKDSIRSGQEVNFIGVKAIGVDFRCLAATGQMMLSVMGRKPTLKVDSDTSFLLSQRWRPEIKNTHVRQAIKMSSHGLGLNEEFKTFFIRFT